MEYHLLHEEPRRGTSVRSGSSLGNVSHHSDRSLRSSVTGSKRKRFDRNTHAQIIEEDEQEVSAAAAAPKPKKPKTKKPKDSTTSTAKSPKSTAKSRKIRQIRQRKSKSTDNADSSASSAIDGVPSSSRSVHGNYSSQFLTPANLAMFNASQESHGSEKSSISVVRWESSTSQRGRGDQSDNGNIRDNEDVSVINIDNNNFAVWWDGSDRPELVDRVHIGRRISIDGRVLQYYQDIPQSTVDIEWKGKHSDRVKATSTVDITKSLPEKGLTHVYFIENFKMPKTMPEGVTYLGHIITVDSKPPSTNRQVKKAVKETKFGISDDYLLYCEKCFEKNDESQMILKGNGKRGSLDILNHFVKIHHVVTDNPKSKQRIVHVRRVNDEYVPVDVVKFDSSSELNALSIAYMLKMIVDNNLPMAVIDSWTFREAFLFLEPRLNIPSRTTMAAILKSTVENQIRPMIKSEFTNVKYMCMILDAWSNRRRQGILAIRVCYFGPNLTWKIKTISIKRIIGRHTSANLADMIYEEMHNWGIIGKVKHITTDGGANIKRAIAEVKDLDPITEADLAEFQPDEKLITSVIASVVKKSGSLPPNMESSLTVEEEAESLPCTVESEMIEDQESSPSTSESYLIEEEEEEGDSVSPENIVDPVSENLEKVKSDARIVHGPLLTTVDDDDEDKYEGEDSCFWLHCVAHGSQILLSKLEKDFPEVKEVCDRNKHIGRFCRREQVAARIKKDTGVSLLKACKTRWSSNVSSANTLWDMKMIKAVNLMIEEEKRLRRSVALIPEPISAEEYEKLHEFILVLGPLAILTDRMQKDGIVSHKTIPDILECYLRVAALEGLVHFKAVQLQILIMMEERHSVYLTDKDLILATVLNPACKIDFFKKLDSGYVTVKQKHLYKKSDKSTVRVSVENLQIPKSSTVKELARKHLVSYGERRKAAAGCLNRCDSSSKTKSGLISIDNNEFIRDLMTRDAVATTAAESQTDLDLYLQMPVNVDVDVTAFWTSKYNELPYLSRFVEFFFIKMPSSGSVERLFSILANVDIPDRCSASDKTLESRMMYKENMNIVKRVKTTGTKDMEVKSFEAKVLESVQNIRRAKVL